MSSNRSSPQSILCTAGYDHTIRFWDPSTAQECRKLQHADSQVNRLSISPDRKNLAVAGNPHIRLFEIYTQNLSPVTSFEGHTNNVTAVGFHKEMNFLYSASEDGTVKIWDMRATGCQRNLINKSSINCAFLNPNQGEIITGDINGQIRVWDLNTNKCVFEIYPDGNTAIRDVCMSTDGSIVTAGNNRGIVFVWNVEKGQFVPLTKIEAHNSYVLKVLLSSDGKYLATTSSDKTAKIWKVEGGYSLDKTLVGHQRWIWDCVFSADSAYFITASSDKTARLWDLSTGESITEYNGHHKAVTCVSLSDVQ